MLLMEEGLIDIVVAGTPDLSDLGRLVGHSPGYAVGPLCLLQLGDRGGYHLW
jgi:hypothetical protein